MYRTAASRSTGLIPRNYTLKTIRLSENKSSTIGVCTSLPEPPAPNNRPLESFKSTAYATEDRGTLLSLNSLNSCYDLKVPKATNPQVSNVSFLPDAGEEKQLRW